MNCEKAESRLQEAVKRNEEKREFYRANQESEA